MIQPRDRSRSGIGSDGLRIALAAFLVCGTACLSGCSEDQGEGMIANPKDATKSQDAQDSMKDYMKQMQSKGMKPGMKPGTKSAAPAK